jgi:hypothetical protein
MIGVNIGYKPYIGLVPIVVIFGTEIMAPVMKNKSADHELSADAETASCVLPSPVESATGGDSLMAPASGYKFQFDFEVGYLIKSPCKKCPHLAELPQCADNCRILDGIHSVLSRIVSCTRRR